MSKKLLSILILCTGVILKAGATEECVRLTEADIIGLFDRWNYALQTQSPDNVEALYDEDAVFVSSTATVPLTNRSEIRRYFTHFLQSRPMAHVNERMITGNCHLATDKGSYTFSILAKGGDRVNVTSTYSFIYRRTRDGKWVIAAHESSGLPH